MENYIKKNNIKYEQIMIIINCAKSEEFRGKTFVSIMKIPRELRWKVATEYFKSIGWPIPEDSISDELFSRLFVSDDPGCYSDDKCKDVILSLKTKLGNLSENSNDSFSEISGYIERKIESLANMYRDQVDISNLRKLIAALVLRILDKVNSDINVLKNIMGLLISKIISKSSLIEEDRDLDCSDANVHIEGSNLFVNHYVMNELISGHVNEFGSLRTIIRNLYNQLDYITISFSDDGYMCRTKEDEFVFFDSKLVSALKNRGHTTVDALKNILFKINSMVSSFKMVRVNKNYVFDISCIYEKFDINIDRSTNSLIVDTKLDYIRKFISTSLIIPLESLFKVDDSGMKDILGRDKYDKLSQEYDRLHAPRDDTLLPQECFTKDSTTDLVIAMKDKVVKNLGDNTEETSSKRSFRDIVDNDSIYEGSLKRVKLNEAPLISSNNITVNRNVVFNTSFKEESEAEIGKFDDYIKQQGHVYSPYLLDGEFLPYVHLMKKLYCKSRITLDTIKRNGLEWMIDMMIDDDILTIDEFNEIDNPMGDIFGDYLFKMKELGGKLNMKIHEIRLKGLKWTVDMLMEHNLLKK